MSLINSRILSELIQKQISGDLDKSNKPLTKINLKKVRLSEKVCTRDTGKPEIEFPTKKMKDKYIAE